MEKETAKITEAMKLLAHMVKDAQIENKLVSQETIDAADTILTLTHDDDWKEIQTKEMDSLLDDVFCKVFRKYPYVDKGITGPQDCTDYICFCETEEMQCGDIIEKETPQ